MKTRIKITNDKKELWLHFGEQAFVDFLAGKTALADVVTSEVLLSAETRDGSACHKPLQGIAKNLDVQRDDINGPLEVVQLVTPWLAPHLFEILPTTKVFRRGNLRVELDLDEVYPDDPGAGAPAMVYWTSKFVGKIGEYSATYPYAIGEGELESRLETRRLTDKQCEWLDSLGDKIDEFLG